MASSSVRRKSPKSDMTDESLSSISTVASFSFMMLIISPFFYFCLFFPSLNCFLISFCCLPHVHYFFFFFLFSCENCFFLLFLYFLVRYWLLFLLPVSLFSDLFLLLDIPWTKQCCIIYRKIVIVGPFGNSFILCFHVFFMCSK